MPRHRYHYLLALFIGILAAAGCSTTQDRAITLTAAGRETTEAQILSGMGPHERDVTTDSEEAQLHFNQGLNWYYAFNHDEAMRSFRRAGELDPGCAMAWWGAALSAGPNYNDPIMTVERSRAAWENLRRALDAAAQAAPVERALIEALARRYAETEPEDRSRLDRTYADAMARVWEANPRDCDAGALYAEALMVLRPWQLYSTDKQPAEDTPRIVAVLERVLEVDPEHPGANHLYIHAIEPSKDPGKAVAAADRLCDLVPASGHLQHMPTHIYVQVGEWDKSVLQNEKAMTADAEYRELSPDQTFQHMYMTHNAHMLVFAAMMSGREQDALDAARAMWQNVPPDKLREVAPILDPWMCAVYDVHKRFGRWDAILAEPAPPDFLPITKATWMAARAVAWASKKNFDRAEREHAAFREAKAALPQDAMWFTDRAHDVLAVSDAFIAGEIALHKGDLDLAAAKLEEGARLEDALTYSEPPQWLQPVRHALGAVYLASGRYEDAERVYREDLAKWPGNGWALYGLSRALERQGKAVEADAVERRYRLAWGKADAPTETSCMCIPQT